MYYSGSSAPVDYRDKKFLTDAVQDWYSEIKVSNSREINSYNE